MPAQKYYNAAGESLTSVTRALKNLGWSTTPLMIWANNEGLDGRVLWQNQTKAADVGTIVHLAIKAEIKKEKDFDLVKLIANYGLDEDDERNIRLALQGWERWKKKTKFKIVASEEKLVSEKYQYGGTMDAVMVDGERVVIDFKTAKGVYPDNLCQIRAYMQLWEENKGEKIEALGILRLGKTDGSAHYHEWPVASPAVEAAWDSFLKALALDKNRKLIEGAI
jgi:hypothetical protein